MTFRDYQLYGIVVRSEIPLTFPEQQVAGRVDVTFSLAPRRWFDEMTTGLPSVATIDDWYERRCGDDGSDFLRFPDLFEFMVSADGRSVACGLLERATAESFQTYLLGHVLSFALVKQGFEPLHATTVVIEGAAIAFLGSSGQGKSTLAAVFLHAGHQMLTDDLLLIREVGGNLCGFPGPPRIKLFPDVARRFLPGQAALSPMNPDTAKLIIPLECHQVHAEPAPLQGFFVLDDCEPDAPGIRLSVLSARESMIELLRSTFNRRLVTPERLQRQFLAARTWARRIPVRRLAYPRTLEDIEDVREVIVSTVRSTSMLVS